MTTSAGYITVVNWEKFQHYKDREPRWIKLYRALLDNDQYLGLSGTDRAVLHGIWMLTARVGNGRASAELGLLRRQLNLRVRSLDPLIHAGFIEIRASKALAERYHNATPEGLLRNPQEDAERATSAAPASREKDELSGRRRGSGRKRRVSEYERAQTTYATLRQTMTAAEARVELEGMYDSTQQDLVDQVIRNHENAKGAA